MCDKECEDGYVLDPFVFCKCIPDEDRYAMFCMNFKDETSEFSFVDILLHGNPVNSSEVTRLLHEELIFYSDNLY